MSYQTDTALIAEQPQLLVDQSEFLTDIHLVHLETTEQATHSVAPLLVLSQTTQQHYGEREVSLIDSEEASPEDITSIYAGARASFLDLKPPPNGEALTMHVSNESVLEDSTSAVLYSNTEEHTTRPQEIKSILRFPCRSHSSRQHDCSHTSRTAYVEVPPDTEHGDFLTCSHPICDKLGKRYRYCAVCRRPMDWRNFKKRHSHGRPLVTAGRYKKRRRTPSPPSQDENTPMAMPDIIVFFPSPVESLAPVPVSPTAQMQGGGAITYVPHDTQPLVSEDEESQRMASGFIDACESTSGLSADGSEVVVDNQVQTTCYPEEPFQEEDGREWLSNFIQDTSELPTPCFDLDNFSWASNVLVE